MDDTLHHCELATIIVNYRAGQLICDGLQELVRQHRAFRAPRIFIVDNNSENGDATLLNEFVVAHELNDIVSVIAHPLNDGFGAGNNVALQVLKQQSIKPDFILFLNPDAALFDGSLQTLVNHLKSHEKAGIVGPRLESNSGEVQTSAFRFFSIAGDFESTIRTGPFSKLLSKSVVALPPQDDTLRVDWVSGAVFMARGTVLEKAGWFDEAFFLYFEETDLMQRVQSEGYEIWHLPRARAVHLEGYTTGNKGGVRTEEAPSGHWYRSRNLYFQKHKSSIGRLLADIAWVTGASFFALRCLLTGKPVKPQWQKIRLFLAHWRNTQRLN